MFPSVEWMFALALISTLHSGQAWKPIVRSSPSSLYNHQELLPGTRIKTHAVNTLSIGEVPKSGVDGFDTNLAIAHIPSINFDAEEEGYDYKYGESRDFSAGVIEDPCAVKKYAFNYDGTVDYKNKIPELDQFTICYWMRFTNHSGDHVLLTYAVKDEPREIQFWVANSMNSSFLSMAVKGQQVYRLNYPLRTRRWHHMCTSWNGKTGEWQVWLRAERIGRGFHNALVGHKVPAAGKMFSGGLSQTGELSQGLHFEMTLVQIYRVALSAGKAHRDHKHHHVHHFDHEGQELSTTTKAPPKINRPLPMHSLLASGQIPTQVRINLAAPQPSALPTRNINENIVNSASDQNAVTIHTNFVRGQFHTGSRLVTEQLIGSPIGPALRTRTTQSTAAQTFNNPANVQFIDETETHVLFKRQARAGKQASQKAGDAKSADGKVLGKRELVLLQDGRIVDDSNMDVNDFQFEGLAEFGGQKFKHDLTAKMNIEDEIKEHDREPAEEEVKAVMALCGSCDVEPFLGAIVFAWKDAVAELDNALKGVSVGRCGSF